MRDFTDRGGWWVVGQGIAFLAVAGCLWWGGSADVSAWLLAIGITIVVPGMILAADGVFRIRRHITAMPAPVTGAPLIDGGAYGLARHPIYGGLVLMSLGLAAARASLIGAAAALALGAFFILKSRHEELLLAAAYPAYAAYRERVRKRLIPWLV